MESQYLFSNVDVIPQDSQEICNIENSNYDLLIEEYGTHQGVSLAKFCKDKGIDLGSFKEYRRKMLKK